MAPACDPWSEPAVVCAPDEDVDEDLFVTRVSGGVVDVTNCVTVDPLLSVDVTVNCVTVGVAVDDVVGGAVVLCVEDEVVGVAELDVEVGVLEVEVVEIEEVDDVVEMLEDDVVVRIVLLLVLEMVDDSDVLETEGGLLLAMILDDEVGNGSEVEDPEVVVGAGVGVDVDSTDVAVLVELDIVNCL